MELCKEGMTFWNYGVFGTFLIATCWNVCGGVNVNTLFAFQEFKCQCSLHIYFTIANRSEEVGFKAVN